MIIVFAIVGVLFFIGGLGSCATAKTVIHETAGMVSLLIGSLFITVAFLLERLQGLGKLLTQIRDRLPLAAPPPGPSALVCGNCRKEIPEGTRVCPHCGTKLALPARSA